MKIKFSTIREWVWPLIEKETHIDVNQPAHHEQELRISDENLDLALQLQTRVYQEEEDRRKGTESKAALFMGSLSVATSIILAANTVIWNEKTPPSVKMLTVSICFILAIYTLRTVWFSVKVLERGTYSVLGEDEINVSGDKASYLKHLICSLSSMNKYNELTINAKVTNLVMAQEYYKRAIVLICLYALMTLVFCFWV